MTEETRKELDAITEGAAGILRDAGELPPLQAEYAETVAGYLAVQFPDVPELSRIVIACASYVSALADSGVSGPAMMLILGVAGLRLAAAAREERGSRC